MEIMSYGLVPHSNIHELEIHLNLPCFLSLRLLHLLCCGDSNEYERWMWGLASAL